MINSNATPFYPASYVPVPPQHPPAMSPSMPPSNYITSPPVSSQGPHQGVAVGAPPPGVPSPHPNLFLYSPSSNTMIPCEEIIIPNAVVPGQDVYQVKRYAIIFSNKNALIIAIKVQYTVPFERILCIFQCIVFGKTSRRPKWAVLAS